VQAVQGVLAGRAAAAEIQPQPAPPGTAGGRATEKVATPVHARCVFGYKARPNPY
jgi:hypothetical protein